MASLLTPYVNFRGNAREALEFYQTVFGGTLAITAFGEFGMGGPADADKIMHGQLETPSGFTLMASDAPEGMPVDAGSSITIAITGDDVDDLRGYFHALAEGGTVSMPLEKQMWGDEYGACVDKFGVSWMANIGTPQQ